MRSSSSCTFTSSKWTLLGVVEGNVFFRWSSRAHLEGSRVRAVALGDGLGPAAPLLVALSFGHSATFYYTTAVTTRAARWKQAGRPLQGTAFPS